MILELVLFRATYMFATFNSWRGTEAQGQDCASRNRLTHRLGGVGSKKEEELPFRTLSWEVHKLCSELGIEVSSPYKLDRDTSYPVSGDKGTKRNNHFQRFHGRFHNLSGADLAAKSHRCTPWPLSSIFPP